MLRAVVACAVMLLSVACAETVPLGSPTADAMAKTFAAPPDGRAALYVVRPDKTGDIFTVTLGQKSLGLLTKATYLRVDVRPGSYDLRCRSTFASDAGFLLPVTLAPGSTTYVTATFTMSGPSYCRELPVDIATGQAAVIAATRIQEIGGASD